MYTEIYNMQKKNRSFLDMVSVSQTSSSMDHMILRYGNHKRKLQTGDRQYYNITQHYIPSFQTSMRHALITPFMTCLYLHSKSMHTSTLKSLRMECPHQSLDTVQCVFLVSNKTADFFSVFFSFRIVSNYFQLLKPAAGNLLTL